LLSLFIFFERGEHATITWKYSAIQAEHHHHHHHHENILFTLKTKSKGLQSDSFSRLGLVLL
jgi:hypothetical protein